MPIDYSRYPKNWKTEIRPRIMARSGGICEAEGCGFAHGQIVLAVKRNGKTIGWYKTIEETAGIQISREAKRNPKTGIVEIVPNPKPVKVVLTIAHLDHDETNHDVGDERLAALCQLCHLRYDAKEKYRRRNNPATVAEGQQTLFQI